MVGFVKGVFGGSGLDLSAVTLTPEKALAGEKFYDANGILRTGTIASLPASTITLAGAATSLPAGKYLAGAQTIAWDSDIAAGNIKTGKNIFGVGGAYPYIGSFTPASATKSYTLNNLPFAPSGIYIFISSTSGRDYFSWPMVTAYNSAGDDAIVCYDDSSWEFDLRTNIGTVMLNTNAVFLDFSNAVSDGAAYLEPKSYNYIIW